MLGTLIKLGAEAFLKTNSKKTALKEEHIFQGPVSKKRITIHTCSESVGMRNKDMEITYFLEGDFNERNCGKGSFELILLKGAHYYTDKTCYSQYFGPEEFKLGIFSGEVKFGKMEGEGEFFGDVPSWMFEGIEGMTYASYGTFNGTLKNNRFDGKVKHYVLDTLRYEGNAKEGKISGIGAYYLKNGQKLITLRDSTNQKFKASFYDVANDKIIFTGTFNDKKIIDGRYFVKGEPYTLNKDCEVELPDGTYKLKESINFRNIYSSEIIITKIKKE